MPSNEECLQQIDEICDAARDPSAAYLIRSRLRRTILACARLVAESTGTEKPRVPGVFDVPASGSESDREVIRLCNRIYGIAGELCQPSEAFATRWETGWKALSIELHRLAVLLQNLEAPSTGAPSVTG
jgi:hypothetical protein